MKTILSKQINKKAFFWIIPIIWMLLAIVILILFIWFGFKISEGLVAIFNFLYKYWWAIGLSLIGFFYRDIIKSLMRKVFKI